jgi:hypothetical protein
MSRNISDFICQRRLLKDYFYPVPRDYKGDLLETSS